MTDVTAILTSPLANTLVELAAYYARKAMEANQLLAQAQAEKREPTTEEVLAVHAENDAEKASLLANIDKHSEQHFGKVRHT